MISIQRLLVAALLIALVLGAKLKSKKDTQDEGNTVVEANHFFSDKELSTSYDIKGVKTDSALIVTLRPKEEGEEFKNKIEIKLDAGSKDTTCEFDDFNSVCILEEVSQEDVKLKIKCSHLPC